MKWDVYAFRCSCRRHLVWVAHGPDLAGLLGFDSSQAAHTYARRAVVMGPGLARLSMITGGRRA